MLRLSGADQHFLEWYYGKVFIAWDPFFFWGIWLWNHFDFFKKISRRLGTLGLASIPIFALCFRELFREAHIYGYDARQYFMFSGLPFQFIAATFVLAVLYRRDRRGSPVKLPVTWSTPEGTPTGSIWPTCFSSAAS